MGSTGAGDRAGPPPPAAGHGRAQPGPALRVFAAGSLRAAFDALAERWHEGIVLRYANARVLADAILAGDAADVFASASPHEPARLAELGIAWPSRAFASNHLVVAVPAGSDLETIGELAEPGTRVIIEIAGIPLGDYTRELLERLDGGLGRRILANVVGERDNVDAVTACLYGGEADAAIVYASDVATSAGRLRAIEPPRDAGVRATYVVCALRDAARPAAARAWIDLVLGPSALELLATMGFGPPDA